MKITYQNRAAIKKGMIIHFEIFPDSNTADCYREYMARGVWVIVDVDEFGFTFDMKSHPADLPRKSFRKLRDSYQALTNGYSIIVDSVDGISSFTNKGRTNCIQCSCPTEKRRDFSDMTVRDMCPRCKF